MMTAKTNEEIQKEIAERIAKNAFMHYNHVEMITVDDNKAIGKLTIHPDSLNTYGYVHGGAVYTLADNVTGYAAHLDGRSYVTQHGGLNFISNQSAGIIYGEAKVKHRGKATCVVSVEILGDNRKLLASGEFILFCINK